MLHTQSLVTGYLLSKSEVNWVNYFGCEETRYPKWDMHALHSGSSKLSEQREVFFFFFHIKKSSALVRRNVYFCFLFRDWPDALFSVYLFRSDSIKSEVGWLSIHFEMLNMQMLNLQRKLIR